MTMQRDDWPRFLEDDLPEVSAEEAYFHLFPVPLERTVSYGGGTAAGPRAILEASRQLEAFDGEGVPGRAGIYLHPPQFYAQGESVEKFLESVAEEIYRAHEGKHFPILLGGEHTASYAGILAASRFFPELGVVQIDAHADLREDYQGDRWSHACIMRRVLDHEIPVLQLGVRSLSQGEHRFREESKVTYLDAAELVGRGLPRVLFPADFPRHVYVTFDIDAFDPSLMPATGTPEPGGLDWYGALALLDQIAMEREVVAADVVELAPLEEVHSADFIAAKLVYQMMGIFSAK